MDELKLIEIYASNDSFRYRQTFEVLDGPELLKLAGFLDMIRDDVLKHLSGSFTEEWDE